jgi:hypothetical protein
MDATGLRAREITKCALAKIDNNCVMNSTIAIYTDMVTHVDIEH